MGSKTSRSPVTTVDQRHLAVQAYLFLYPLVSMEVARLRMTLGRASGSEVAAPPNTFWHQESDTDPGLVAGTGVADPSLRLSSAWLDLRDGPVVLSCDGTHGRYHLLPMVDMWNEVFAAPGTRTTGNGHGAWAVVPPGWDGYLPPVMRRVDAPTVHVWVRGRIRAGAGRAPVQHVQRSLHLTPLARWTLPAFRPDPTPLGPDPRPPVLPPVESMSGAEFFGAGLRLLGRHGVRPEDASALTRLERLGILPGDRLEELEPSTRAALGSAPPAALHLMRAARPQLGRRVNGWRVRSEATDVQSSRYLVRAAVAMSDLGADLPQDQARLTLERDPDGGPLLGSRGYRLHFDADRLPPGDAVWSLTVLDRDGVAVASRGGTAGLPPEDALPRAADGSVDVRLQHDDPGGAGRAHWLPTPHGRFSVCLRVYAPPAEVLDGTWTPPAPRARSAVGLVGQAGEQILR